MLTGAGSARLILGTVLLGAGSSSRMGQPKLLLPWGATSVLGHHLILWRQLGATQVAVVCPPQPHPVHDELNHLQFSAADRIINPRPELGMFSSIQCAARWPDWTRSLTHWALVLGDQPHLPIAVLRLFLDFAAVNPQRVAQPSRGGRARHPVILPAAIFHRLACSTTAHLQEFLHSLPEPVALCEIDHPALDLDLDTPADYQRALLEFPPHGNPKPEFRTPK
jgi:molybdenum cofactor cytidylyltransferase